ncbi:hypothetical protein LZZ85_12235 [Terrimonas sp. NA20]|uniref:PEGA domain-containing protein n=1 Tax=Terrimonas ginsenosidimutans TaxID=2908004 RepID=A0ABS9KRY1_9BACT|nr:hypothetical protein [Terrimonas ginsenosidimutans]MCG2615058.1 hypothetical protein [Terrimonas ginsenosidimutans]
MKRFFKTTTLTFLLLCIITVMYSCKKDKTPTGNLMFYTFLQSSKYDAIKIFVDGKESGTITLSHIQKPECGTPTGINVINVALPAGKHTWSAKQIKNGQQIDEWEEREETIKVEECTFIKLAD